MIRIAATALAALAGLPGCDLSRTGPAEPGIAPAPSPDQELPVQPEESTLAAVAPPDEAWRPPPPTLLFDVVKVVDGDTIHVERDGVVEKLRLLSVDTEEKIGNRPSTSVTKPDTVYGQETALWAKDFFAALAKGESLPQVGLLFPPDPLATRKDGSASPSERRDVYGRLLCHVILPDGTDFNLLLVKTGRSPYFNKYGNSRLCHSAFVAAQKRARSEGLGLWNPTTNQPGTPGAPAAKRPYDQLLPWWEARARAIEGFLARQAEDPDAVVEADDPAGLQRALERCAENPGTTVEVFGTIDRFFDEKDGSWTILFRSGDRRRALRAVIPAAARSDLASLDLVGRREEFTQNFLYVSGVLERGPRGFRLRAARLDQWRVAGPEPETENAEHPNQPHRGAASGG